MTNQGVYGRPVVAPASFDSLLIGELLNRDAGVSCGVLTGFEVGAGVATGDGMAPSFLTLQRLPGRVVRPSARPLTAALVLACSLARYW